MLVISLKLGSSSSSGNGCDLYYRSVRDCYFSKVLQQMPITTRSGKRIDYAVFNKTGMSDGKQSTDAAGTSKEPEAMEFEITDNRPIDELEQEHVEMAAELARIDKLHQLEVMKKELQRKKAAYAASMKVVASSPAAETPTTTPPAVGAAPTSAVTTAPPPAATTAAASVATAEPNGEFINLGEYYAPQATGIPQLSVLPAQAQQAPIQPAQYAAQTQLASTLLAQPQLLTGLDPMAHFHTPKGALSKYKKISDYIPDAARCGPVEDEIEIAPNVRIVTSGRKRALDTVSSSQWVAANACILAELLQEDTRPPMERVQNALDYQAHTTKVGVMAANFTWRSVILWDDEYRQKQHIHKFRWGSESAHLNLVRLIPREDQKEQKPKPKGGAKPSDQPSRPSACFNWNKDTPCRFIPCKFKHECAWCGSASHPSVRHDQAQATVSQSLPHRA